jgi:BirA family transcriptional regulator, biotin operon repressor / biotin---[acetyl-CoA-carboxylase] ligase
MLDGTGWPEPRWSASTTSTNADALRALPVTHGTVFGSDEQVAGRGRLDRTWVSEPGAGLWFSLVLDPIPGPLALAIGLGITRGLAPWASVGLKWPNDVVIGQRKLGGILIEAAAQSVVGIGLNLQTPDIPGAIGLADITDGPWTREEVLAGVLHGVHAFAELLRVNPQELVSEYRNTCVTLGRQVTVALPDGTVLAGTAVDVDDDGHLMVKSQDTTRTVFAGDVIHATI